MAAGIIDSELPMVAAPMAGGPSSLQLAEAVGRAGGFPFLAAANAQPETVAAHIAQARSWDIPFGVNLFITGDPPNHPRPVEQYRQVLAPQAENYGLELQTPQLDDDDQWPQKLDLLCQDPVPAVSFTFGLPAAQQISRLRRTGTAVVATVTNAGEAEAAEAAGADALVVQGPAAGGHSGTWDPARAIKDRPTAEVVREANAATNLPLIAAGGVDGPHKRSVHCCGPAPTPCRWAHCCCALKNRGPRSCTRTLSPASASPKPWCPGPLPAAPPVGCATVLSTTTAGTQ